MVLVYWNKKIIRENETKLRSFLFEKLETQDLLESWIFFKEQWDNLCL